nr:MAG TPA: hypothetical protein [Caudoviricetes sp.]
MIGSVYVYLKSDKSKYFKLKSAVYIHQFHPNNPITEKNKELLYERPLKRALKSLKQLNLIMKYITVKWLFMLITKKIMNY